MTFNNIYKDLSTVLPYVIVENILMYSNGTPQDQYKNVINNINDLKFELHINQYNSKNKLSPYELNLRILFLEHKKNIYLKNADIFVDDDSLFYDNLNEELKQIFNN
jgi:hypothetical protein